MAVTPASYDSSLQGVGYGLGVNGQAANSLPPKAQPSSKTTSSGQTRSSASAGTAQPSKSETSSSSTEKSGEKSSDKARQSGELTAEEQQLVAELKIRDREVRAHEQAHISVGGPYVRGSSFEYQTGPDGNRYAIGGEVGIDTSPEKEPESTITKMEIVKRAALAPKDPSAQDRSVAATASERQMEAQAELAQMAVEKVKAASEAKAAERSEAKSAAQGAGKTASYDKRIESSQAPKIDLYA